MLLAEVYLLHPFRVFHLVIFFLLGQIERQHNHKGKAQTEDKPMAADSRRTADSDLSGIFPRLNYVAPSSARLPDFKNSKRITARRERPLRLLAIGLSHKTPSYFQTKPRGSDSASVTIKCHYVRFLKRPRREIEYHDSEITVQQE
jgi:hypothetical protein